LDLKPGRYRLGVANRAQSLIHNEDLEIFDDREIVIEISTTRISGLVLSSTTGRPIADALIVLQELGGPGDLQSGSITTVGSDAQGAFTLGRLSAGRYSLTVRKDRYSPSERVLELIAGSPVENLKLVLSPTVGLDLVILRAFGRAPSVASLAVVDSAGNLMLSETRPVSADGHVRFATVPQGTWELVVSAPGSAATRTLATVPGEPVTLVLPDAAPLRVRVPSLLASNLVATLTLRTQDGRLLEGFGATGNLQYQWPLHGGAGVVERVPAGVWTLRAVASDGQSFLGTVATNGMQELEVVLE